MNSYKLRRYERGLTIDQLAERSHVPARTLRALEAGDVARPSAPTAKALADFYGITVAELLEVTGPENDGERAA